MQPGDADAYVGKVLRDARPSTRTGRAAAACLRWLLDTHVQRRHHAELAAQRFGVLGR
jgi:hypothetical protein